MTTKTGDERHKYWIATNGPRFYYDEPSADMIDVFDCAWAAAMTPRCAGRVTRRYSPAQHMLLVAAIVESDHTATVGDIKVALLHDLPEAYIGDMPEPAKKLLPDYRDLELKIWAAVVDKFDLHDHVGPDGELPEVVQLADKAAFATEIALGIPRGRYEGYDPGPAWWDLHLPDDPVASSIEAEAIERTIASFRRRAEEICRPMEQAEAAFIYLEALHHAGML